MKCSTPVEAAGRDLEGFTMSLNSCKKSLHQSGDVGGTTFATQAGWAGLDGDWREREANRDSTADGGILAANKEPLHAAGGGRGDNDEGVEVAADECGSTAAPLPAAGGGRGTDEEPLRAAGGGRGTGAEDVEMAADE
jgi:hypothetical protein